MRDRTYYKMPDGSIYSVSPRIVALGIAPLEGAVELDEEEKDQFIIRVQTQNELVSRLTADEYQATIKVAFPEIAFQKEKIAIINSNLSEEEKTHRIKKLKPTKKDKEKVADILQKKFFPSDVILNITGIDLPSLEPERDSILSETIIQSESEPEKLSPIQQRREARFRRRQEAKEAKIREEEEKNKVFDDLSDDELLMVQALQDQGLNHDQIRNILIAKQNKKLGREG